MLGINNKMEVFIRCNFGGGPSIPKPPKPPVPPSKSAAVPVAKESLSDGKKGRTSTILNDMVADQKDKIQKKTLLGG